MALELVVLVALAVLALWLSWKFQREQRKLLNQLAQDQKLQLGNPVSQSVYLTQLQLAYQDSQAQVRLLQLENQELSVQLKFQQDQESAR
jgi:hypothetical protein